MSLSRLRSISDAGPGDHLCCIYQTEEEHRALLTPFMVDGLRRHEKVLYLADARSESTVRTYLEAVGVDAAAHETSGQLRFLVARDTYAPNDIFDPDQMIALLEVETARAIEEGYRALRVTGEMSWALRGLPGSERLIEYEAKLNNFFPGKPALAICQYDRRRFTPDVLMHALATHPIAVIGADPVENFYFIPPDEFLGEAREDARLSRAMSTLVDRKRAQEALLRSEDQLRRAQRLARLGSFELERAHGGWRTSVSDELRRILSLREGSEIDDLEEVLVAKAVPEDRELVRSSFQRAKREGAVSAIQYRVRADGGDILWLEGRLEADRDRTVIGTIADITEKRLAEEERERLSEKLRHSRRMQAIGTLAAGVAHGFNNTLMGISGATDMALRKMEEWHPARLHLGQIREAVYGGQSVVRRLLAFSRPREDNVSECELDHVIEASSDLLHHLLGEDLELELWLGAPSAFIPLDAGELHEILTSLLVNARQAMPGGGSVKIRTSGRGLSSGEVQELGLDTQALYAVVEVIDDGPGMSEEALERAFEPFFTTKEEGTGLGLPTVYGLMSQRGGRVQVTSQPGKGTAVTLYAPARLAATRDLPEPPPLPPGEPQGTILLVEDEDLVRLSVRHYLESAGFEVIEASSGPEALERSASHVGALDAVLTDLVLPGGIAGKDLTLRIRSQHPDAAVVYMSAYPEDLLTQQGRIEPGALALSKPFGQSELLRVLRRAMHV